VRRLAIRSVLASRAQDERLFVVDDLKLDTPSTRAVVSLLGALGTGRSALIVPGAAVLPADTINVADMLAHHSLVLTVEAVRRIEALWGGERANGRPRVAASTNETVEE
jgi:large subunit ribosomal protein L4